MDVSGTGYVFFTTIFLSDASNHLSRNESIPENTFKVEKYEVDFLEN
jgi:hypothetical protein